jgi:biotin carboxyl carrier protein
MSYQININGEDKDIAVLKRKGNIVEAEIDGRRYTLDILEVQKGVYSVLKNGKSYNIELVKSDTKKYIARNGFNNYDMEIVDAETRYERSVKGDDVDDSNTIQTPMPGKVVKILVKEGQEVKAGETVIIVSAMKMESEYKVAKDRIVKEILVKEGDNIDGNQPLIILE